MMPPPFDRPLVSPITVGRQAELAQLARLSELSAAGQGQLVLIAGQAGIGKSRLMAEVGQHFTDRPGSVNLLLQGQCFEHDRSTPYAPIRDLLQRLLSGPAAATSTLLGPAAPLLAPLLPTGLLPAGEALVDPADHRSRLDPEAERHQLRQGLMQLLLHQISPGGRTPTGAALLLVIEDLHWCDEASLELLQFLRAYA